LSSCTHPSRTAFRDLLAGTAVVSGPAASFEPWPAAPAAGIDALLARLDTLRDEDERAGNFREEDGRAGALRDEDGGPREGLPSISPERVLLGYAPTALLDGCWLASAVQVRHTHHELGQACLAAFFLETGEGDPALHRGNLYRALLAARGLALPPVEALGVVVDPRFRDEDLALALPGLRLGRCPVDAAPDGGLLPEILGFHAASVALGPPALVRRCAGEFSGRYLADRSIGSPGFRRALDAARRCLAALETRWPACWPRVWRGASALLRSRLAWSTSFRPPPSPLQAMRDLLARKAPHAHGRHGALRLGGRSLDAWFAPQTLDVDALLDALARSPWVRPGSPEQSPLVARSIAFGGAMFGVFSPEEEATLRAWIASLPCVAAGERPAGAGPRGDAGVAPARRMGPSTTAGAASAAGEGSSTSTSTSTSTGEGEGAAGAAGGGGRGETSRSLLLPLSVQERGPGGEAFAPDLPEFYRDLLRSGHDAAVRERARRHVLRALERAAPAGTEKRLREQGLWPWTRGRLGRWVFGQMQEQLGDGAVKLGPLEALSREQVCWLLQQLAPAALVDGAWLQGMTLPGNNHRQEAGLLLKIYHDELGAGVPRQHHGNVLRAALAAQRVELPACDSEAFARWPALLPESFSLPVLWLSLAACSEEFLPELLGLNLAVEMAGVGEVYGVATALLRRHGIDPYFFQLHETIDNAASGHTAWSTEVIEMHLEEASRQGEEAAARAWQRIWRGHGAYAEASRPLVLAAARRLGPGLLWPWLRGKVTALRGAWSRDKGAAVQGLWSRGKGAAAKGER
jgi:hypothetical protein